LVKILFDSRIHEFEADKSIVLARRRVQEQLPSVIDDTSRSKPNIAGNSSGAVKVVWRKSLRILGLGLDIA
jgi:hypothetical protein